jgi:23S rRNA pseudouridine955/2504/2580 synthase
MISLGQRWATNEFRVEEGETGSRLDRLIMSKFDVPRSLLQKILRKGWVRLERPGFATEPDQLAEPHQIARMVPGCGTKVAAGDVIRVTEVFLPEKKILRKPLASLEASDPEAVALLRDSVLYKDDNLLVINKPAGLAVHSGPKTGENHLEAFLEALRFEKDEAPRIVHRLDRDTSGALLLARTKQAAAQLAERFQRAQVDRSVEKYVSMSEGMPYSHPV